VQGLKGLYECLVLASPSCLDQDECLTSVVSHKRNYLPLSSHCSVNALPSDHPLMIIDERKVTYHCLSESKLTAIK
jgi:hypothetical protein